MKITITLLTLTLFLFACQNIPPEKEEIKQYSNWIGDIPFDQELDESNFQLCDSTNVVHRRNALVYKGGKQAVQEKCLELFQFKQEFESFTGYIMIRFLINCEGEFGRFRVQSMEQDFSLKDCPENLTNHLLDITRTLKDWNRRYAKDENSDCSKYLNFKIKNGKVENILH